MSRNHEAGKLIEAAKTAIAEARDLGFDALLEKQKQAWAAIWECESPVGEVLAG